MTADIIDTDVLVIGSGIAGLSAALAAAEMGKQSLVVSKAATGKATNTGISGGGFTFATPTFELQTHIDKTLEAGRLLNDPALVERFADRAAAAAGKLIRRGLDGRHGKSGFNCRTTGFVGGPQISSLLVRACRSAGVKFLENIFVTDLVSVDQVCHGVVGCCKRSGKWVGIRARGTVLAAGGAGGLYAQTDNVPGATGDGYALALRCGLELIDMEFVQFYPLAFAGTGHASMILPPAFADIGRITNRLGEDIKEKYALKEKPIAIVARDRFAQAIFQEVFLGNGIDGALLLDLRRADWSRSPYGSETRTLFGKKLSFDDGPVKITATCHHTMGGLLIDPDGRTALAGLFAAGEVAGGIHGANRMGGNALSDGVTFGEIAGCHAAACDDGRLNPLGFETRVQAIVNERRHLFGAAGRGPGPAELMKGIKALLWAKVGIIRDEATLAEGLAGLDRIQEALSACQAETPRELSALMACRNAALVGRAIALSALARTESRGAHYRADYPCEDEQWRKHVHIRMVDAKPEISRIMPAA